MNTLKGISPLVSTVLLIVIVVAIATIVSSWFTTLSMEQSEKIENTTKQRLACQFADMYIKNATYNCGGNCSAGVNHILTVGIVNSGKKELTIEKMVIKNTTGVIFNYDLNETKTLSVGNALTMTNTSTTTCNGINNTIESVIVISKNCPNNAFDSLPGADVTYLAC
jgi:flagellin-like protein